MQLEEHPTVQQMHRKTVPAVPSKQASLDAGWLQHLVLDAGADDVGCVEIGRPALDDQRHDIFQAFPHTKTLISFVVRLNREAIRTPARSVSNPGNRDAERCSVNAGTELFLAYAGA